MKDAFYDELTETYKSFNAKCRQEPQYFPCIRKENLHSCSNDNCWRMISCATLNGLTISNTTFSHKDIHTATRKSPNGKTLNQIDHVIIQTRCRNTIYDKRSHRGADCDTDHYLVIAKLRSKLKSQTKLNQSKRTKIHIEVLKNENVRKKYENEVMKNLNVNNVHMNVYILVYWE